MPLVSVQMLEGRPPEVRRRLILAMAEAVESALDVPEEAICATLVELPPKNWAHWRHNHARSALRRLA